MRKLFWKLFSILERWYHVKWLRDPCWPRYDEECACPTCGWYAAENHYDCIIDTYGYWSNPSTGGETWTERWHCPRCGTIFEFDTGN